MTEHYIAWWNVENLFDVRDSPNRSDKLRRTLANELTHWEEPVLEKKLEQLSTIIEKMNDNKGPDILGVCEIENEQVLEKLISHISLTDRVYSVAHENTSDKHGIDVFGVTCPAPAFFGDVPLLACGTFTRTGESGPNMETVAVYDLGSLSTDGSGDVSSPYTISGIASGSYDIEFWVGSSVVYQSDGNGNDSFGFGDTIEIVVP